MIVDAYVAPFKNHLSNINRINNKNNGVEKYIKDQVKFDLAA